MRIVDPYDLRLIKRIKLTISHLEMTVAGYGSRTGTDLFVPMPMLLGINIDIIGMLYLDGLCRNSEHARLLWVLFPLMG